MTFYGSVRQVFVHPNLWLFVLYLVLMPVQVCCVGGLVGLLLPACLGTCFLRSLLFPIIPLRLPSALGWWRLFLFLFFRWVVCCRDVFCVWVASGTYIGRVFRSCICSRLKELLIQTTQRGIRMPHNCECQLTVSSWWLRK